MANPTVTMPKATCEKIGQTVARKLFESRGNHAEIHLSEVEVAILVSASIEMVFEKMTISEVGR